MPFSNSESDIVAFSRMYQLPSPEQIKLGLDMNNFKPLAAGKVDAKAHEYSALEITGLNANSTYAIFVALHTQKDGEDLFSLKDETAQIVVQTLGTLLVTSRNRSGKDSITQDPFTERIGRFVNNSALLIKQNEQT